MLLWRDAIVAQGRTVLWLAARAGITSIDDFVVSLSAAAADAGLVWPDVANHPSAKALLAALAGGQSGRLVLILDDAQFLPDDVHLFIEQMIASGRDSLTTIIATRGRSAIRMGRLRSLGMLLEVDARDLAFSVAEAAEFLAVNVRKVVDLAVVEQLVADTLGWPAGIVMACSLDHTDWSQTLDSPTRPSGLRREFEEYFAEEVMLPQPLDIRNFIADTAVLQDLTPSACAAVTGHETSRKTLEDVADMGLFLAPTDQERGSYRYHPLFREMVLRRMADIMPARACELHRRASLHYAVTGEPCLAVDHAEKAKDVVFLADQLDALAEPLTYTGYLYRIDELASDMPWHVLSVRPSLLLALAWRRIRRLAFQSAANMIDAAESCVATLKERGAFDEYDCKRFGRLIEHRRIMLDAAMDDMVTVEHRANVLLGEFGDDEPYLSCTLLAQLMTARRELYHFHDMLRMEAETRKALGRPGSDFASIALKSSVAPTLMVQGKTETARDMLREALALAQSIQGEGSGLAALPALPLAELLYNEGNLEEARVLVDGYLATVRQWGFVDQLAAGHLIKARLLNADGDLKGALAGLAEAHIVAIECGLDRLRAFVVSEQVRLLLKSGQIKAAQAAFEAGDLNVTDEPVPTMNPTRRNESIAVAWLRLEMQNHRLVRARKVAKRWSEFVRRNGATRSAILFELLIAEIAVLAGDRSEARRAVREAVTLAAPMGWNRIFHDEGEAIGSLLVDAYDHGPSLDSVPDRFAARLVAEFNGTPDIETEEDFGLSSKLVGREIEILQMVGGGLRNREIGDRLGLTEGTVKWYMQQIYDKLGVRRRPQAVMRARQLGILA
ncbi:MAG: helix-turn-helix transcriptional regulator [Sphingomonas sp. 28-63-12]|nr:MAG: helix-turn-helix transcriptional regulator [Sphingomonas sp. 28-63-12]